MAASDNKFNCSICLNGFTKPRIIDCHHTFCETCLDDYMNKFTVYKKFNCPVCRKATCIPATGAKGFAINFYVDDLSEVETESDEYVGVCELHHGKAMDIFCSDCSLEICCKCMEDQHRDHNVEYLQNIQSTLAEEVHELMQDLEERISVIQVYADSIKTELTEYDNTTETVCKEVDEQVVRICKATKKLGDHVKSQLRRTNMEERTKLVKILEKRDDDIYHIRSSLVYTKERMKVKSVVNSNDAIKRLSKLERETDLNQKRSLTRINTPLFQPTIDLDRPVLNTLRGWSNRNGSLAEINTPLLYQLFGHVSNSVDDGVLEHTFDVKSIKVASDAWVYSPEQQINNTRWCIGVTKTPNSQISILYKGGDNVAVFCNFMVDISFGRLHGQDHEAQNKFATGTEYKWAANISRVYTHTSSCTIRVRMNRIDNAI